MATDAQRDEMVELPQWKLDHYDAILELGAELARREERQTEARKTLSAANSAVNESVSELGQLIKQGPDPQMHLFGERKAGAEPVEWRDRSLAVLSIPSSLVNALANAVLVDEGGTPLDRAMSTLGDLVDYWDDGGMIEDLKGLGRGKAATLGDAWAAYAEAHPEVTADLEEGNGDE